MPCGPSPSSSSGPIPRATPSDLIKDPAAFALAIERLAATTDDGRVVLVIDQAEDLVLPANRAQAVELVERLQAIDRDRLAVIVVLRSASLDPWMLDTEIGALTPGDPVQIRPLDRAALREVILGPAQLAGIRIEPDTLVEQILDDTVQGEALPLLAALLQELTKNHSRTNPAVITPTEYAAVGPVSRVIERRAQAAVDDVKVKVGRFEADVVDSYLRLVAIDESRQPVRTQLVADDLPADVAAIFGILEDYRLVTRDRRAIPVPADAPARPPALVEPPAAQEILMAVHEAVFRAWSALKAAIDARLDALRIRTWLRHDAEEWAGSKRGQVALTGGRLDLALEWSRDNADEVTPEIRAYIDHSEESTTARQDREARGGRAGRRGRGRSGSWRSRRSRHATMPRPRVSPRTRGRTSGRGSISGSCWRSRRARGASTRDSRRCPSSACRRARARAASGVRQGAHTDSAALSADGSRAVISFSNVVQLWDVGANSRVAAILGPPSVSGISRDGSTVAIAYQVEDEPDQINIAFVAGGGPTPVVPACPVTSRTIAVSPTDDFVVAVVDTPERQPGAGRLDVGLPRTVRSTDSRTPSRISTSPTGASPSARSAAPPSGIPLSDALDTWSTDDTSTVQAIAFGDDDRLGATSDSGDLFIWDTSTPGTAPRQFPVFASDVVGGKLRFSTDLNAWIVGSQKGDLRVVGFDDKFTVGASATSLPMAQSVRRQRHGRPRPGHRRHGDWRRHRRREWPHRHVGPHRDAATRWPCVRRRTDRSAPGLPAGPLIAGGPEGVWQLDGVTGAILGHRATDSVTAIGPGANGWAIGLSTGEVLRTAGPVDGLATVTTVAGPVAAIAMLDSGGVAIADHAGAVTVVEPSGASTVVPLDRPILSLASRGRLALCGCE